MYWLYINISFCRTFYVLEASFCFDTNSWVVSSMLSMTVYMLHNELCVVSVCVVCATYLFHSNKCLFDICRIEYVYIIEQYLHTQTQHTTHCATYKQSLKASKRQLMNLNQNKTKPLKHRMYGRKRYVCKVRTYVHIL